jgi:hypothetical protein
MTYQGGGDELGDLLPRKVMDYIEKISALSRCAREMGGAVAIVDRALRARAEAGAGESALS